MRRIAESISVVLKLSDFEVGRRQCKGPGLILKIRRIITNLCELRRRGEVSSIVDLTVNTPCTRHAQVYRPGREVHPRFIFSHLSHCEKNCKTYCSGNSLVATPAVAAAADVIPF